MREAAEGKPVTIGQLQRYAIDPLIATGKSPYSRAAPTGKRVAIVGAGPAGLACAHALAVAGVESTIFEPREKSGGLNEYGIAAYKTIDDFAAEGGRLHPVDRRHRGEARHRRSAATSSSNDLRRDYDAVFLGVGLGSTNKFGLAERDRARKRRSTRSTISRACGRRRTCRRCRSAGASW